MSNPLLWQIILELKSNSWNGISVYRMRQIIILSFIEGMKDCEIAEELGISQNMVFKSKALALNKIRARYLTLRRWTKELRVAA